MRWLWEEIYLDTAHLWIVNTIAELDGPGSSHISKRFWIRSCFDERRCSPFFKIARRVDTVSSRVAGHGAGSGMPTAFEEPCSKDSRRCNRSSSIFKVARALASSGMLSMVLYEAVYPQPNRKPVCLPSSKQFYYEFKGRHPRQA